MKIEKYDILVKLMIFHMIVTLSSDMIPDGFPLGKIVGGIIVIDLFAIVCSGITKRNLICLLASVVICLLSSFYSTDYNKHFSDMIYYFSTILFFANLSNIQFVDGIKNSMYQNQRFMKVALFYVYVICFVGLFLPECYEGKWGGSYYYGFAQSTHVLCSGMCMSVAFIYYLILKNNGKELKKIMYFMPALLFILISGSRVFLIPILVVILLWSFVECTRNIYSIIGIPLLAILIIYLISISGFADKTLYSINNFYTSSNILDRFTSGRTIFWEIDIKAVLNSDIVNLLFGHGFDYVYLLNAEEYGRAIWAHNDVIDLLLSIGITGTVIYIVLFLAVFKQNFLSSKYRIYLIFYSLVVAIINGFFGYQHYMISFIILYCTVIDEQNYSELVDESRYVESSP